jgi:23S rRNA (pseudouridine1915-N3)-methyltransferase
MSLSYLDRARDAGRPLGLAGFVLHEIDDRKPENLVNACAAGDIVIALDERGKSLTSPDFAQLIGRLRDDGESRLVFVIGGSDGLPAAVRTRARSVLSFGSQTWPHLLVRAMLAEQLYRAVTILSGHPYHRA